MSADDVLGIVASFLKADGQDLTCANLNMASRTLRAETMQTLWGTVTFPRVHDPQYRRSWDGYEAVFRRTVNAQGAKYIRYVQILVRYCHSCGRGQDG
jgi:hypothetical protein